ncbi:MAG: prepilin-type N-terminal cleavage/methylation domain-containing protein [Bilophila wadsworthia]
MQPPFRNGFTLIEIVSVLVVLGVLAYLGISAFRGNDEITAYAERDRLLSRACLCPRARRGDGRRAMRHHRYKHGEFLHGRANQPRRHCSGLYAFRINPEHPPATFCFHAAGSVCGEDSFGNPNDTGILYCTASASDQTFSFGGGITLTLFAETGFVQ